MYFWCFSTESRCFEQHEQQKGTRYQETYTFLSTEWCFEHDGVSYTSQFLDLSLYIPEENAQNETTTAIKIQCINHPNLPPKRTRDVSTGIEGHKGTFFMYSNCSLHQNWMLSCLSLGATHCHKALNVSISLASIPIARRFRAYSCIIRKTKKKKEMSDVVQCIHHKQVSCLII